MPYIQHMYDYLPESKYLYRLRIVNVTLIILDKPLFLRTVIFAFLD